MRGQADAERRDQHATGADEATRRAHARGSEAPTAGMLQRDAGPRSDL